MTLQAIGTAVRQGKVRYFGASNHAEWQLCKLLWLADRQGGPPVVSSQIPLRLLRREFHPDLAFCQQHGIGVTSYQSLQGGLLTGKYRRGQPAPADSRAAEKPDWMWKTDDGLFDRLEAIERLAVEAGVSTTRLALSWALAQPAISSLIVGVKRLAQLEDAIAATDVRISAEHHQILDTICPPPWCQPDPIRG